MIVAHVSGLIFSIAAAISYFVIIVCFLIGYTFSTLVVNTNVAKKLYKPNFFRLFLYFFKSHGFAGYPSATFSSCLYFSA